MTEGEITALAALELVEDVIVLLGLAEPELVKRFIDERSEVAESFAIAKPKPGERPEMAAFRAAKRTKLLALQTAARRIKEGLDA
jgi:hypothetical protein